MGRYNPLSGDHLASEKGAPNCRPVSWRMEFCGWVTAEDKARQAARGLWTRFLSTQVPGGPGDRTHLQRVSQEVYPPIPGPAPRGASCQLPAAGLG